MGEWTALAEQLADEIREPGYGAAAVFARAYRARVDLAGVRGLVGAAMALTGGDALTALCAFADPCPDHATLVNWTEEMEAHVVTLLRRCDDLGRAARGEYTAATQARAIALATVQSTGETEEAARVWAAARAEEAALVMTDCAAALEILGEADCKLRYARDLLRAVPGELAEVYEAPIALTARGGKMPHSGDFIAPGEPPGKEQAWPEQCAS
jgi:hypothetical protein